MSARRPAGPLRAVIVDDSGLMRSLLRSALEAEGDMRAVGLAEDVTSARRLIKELDPDVVTLDVEMPGMNGLEFLRKIMTLRPMPVVMVSSHTAEGAETTLTALQYGAVDVVQKPGGADPLGSFGRELREKVRLAARANVRHGGAVPARPAPPRAAAPRQAAALGRAALPPVPPAPRGGRRRSLIAVGASTGGVAALSDLLDGLPDGLPPIVIAQHMPPGYTARFARRLRDRLGRDVAEGRDGEVLAPGMVRIAPGGQHLGVAAAAGQLTTRLLGSAPVSGHCPSVDVLFGSVAEAVGAAAVGAILTGMGRDGAAGLRAMRGAGAVCLGQSERTCVVYGMPRAARELGAVQEEVDLDRLSARICDFVSGAPSRAASGA